MHKYYITQNIILQILYYTNNFAQILYSYLRYADRLSDVFFLLLVVILSELHENPRRKDLSYRKKYLEEFLRGSSLFRLHALLMSFFVALFCLLWFYAEKNFASEGLGEGGSGSPSELDFLRPWYGIKRWKREANCFFSW